MDQDAFLAAISAAVKRKQAGEDPEANPTPIDRVIPPSNPNDLSITPGKPDPEASANSQINAAANAPMDPRKTMNPATGLPMSVSQPAPSQADQDRLDQANFRVQYLKKMSGQGQ
jgi:hypothetical protein